MSNRVIDLFSLQHNIMIRDHTIENIGQCCLISSNTYTYERNRGLLHRPAAMIVFTERLLTPAADLMQRKSNEGAFVDPLNWAITLPFCSLKSSKVGKTCTVYTMHEFDTWDSTFLYVSRETIHKNGLPRKCFCFLYP